MPHSTTQQWSDLVDHIKSTTPPELGKHAWYLMIAASLATSPSPELLAEFYSHLTQHDDFQQTEARQTLSLQFRDILLKQVTLNGAPQVLMAMTPLAAAEGEPVAKSEESQLSPKWSHVDRDKIHDRGLKTIHSIYGHDLLHNRIFPQWGHHTRDIQFMELFTVYGLYLSDFEQLTAIETELVVFTTIQCLGLGLGPALWHLRGLGRLLGARGSDENLPEMRKIKDILRSLKVATMAVVEFAGQQFLDKAKLDSWPNVGDVVRVLDGWGEGA